MAHVHVGRCSTLSCSLRTSARCRCYAFCNTHDVTWGTKGDNVMKTDLGGAVGKGSTVELEMPSEQLDIDSGYDEALRNLRDRVEVPDTPISDEQLQQDYYKSVRTYMVVSWMIANAILAMAASEAYGGSSIGDNFYLRFILWSVATLGPLPRHRQHDLCDPEPRQHGNRRPRAHQPQQAEVDGRLRQPYQRDDEQHRQQCEELEESRR